MTLLDKGKCVIDFRPFNERTGGQSIKSIRAWVTMNRGRRVVCLSGLFGCWVVSSSGFLVVKSSGCFLSCQVIGSCEYLISGSSKHVVVAKRAGVQRADRTGQDASEARWLRYIYTLYIAAGQPIAQPYLKTSDRTPARPRPCLFGESHLGPWLCCLLFALVCRCLCLVCLLYWSCLFRISIFVFMLFLYLSIYFISILFYWFILSLFDFIFSLI